MTGSLGGDQSDSDGVAGWSDMTVFRVWAPRARRVRVRLGDEHAHPLAPDSEGWWSAELAAPASTDYLYLLDDDERGVPDPRSRWQPAGVHGPSRVYDDDAYAWRDAGWLGRQWPGSVVYELHVGTFTPAGTFDGAIERLDHLVSLGVTHVELLPVNAFNGTWNWGYDGADWYAVHEPYGGPDGLKRFVDACHAAGLAVVLDVVYNHLGPSGNYLPRFGPYLAAQRNTWGEVINLDGPDSGPVRSYIIDNALMWLRHYHVDGLRLDAVHALVDTSSRHLLADLSEQVDELEIELGRTMTVIAESDLNDPIMITPRADGGYGLDAQWDDDVHHALHAVLSGEREGYYADFGSLAVLAKVYTSAFLHDGTYSTFRHAVHGRPVDREHTAGSRFVTFLQNHDQVGNRARGDRLAELTSPDRLAIGAVLLLTSPFVPLLWMGEEWATRKRWPFFSSHPEPALAEATGRGRVEEFAGYGWDTAGMPDPQDPGTFRSATLDWSELATGRHADMLVLYRRLIALRAAEPDLGDALLSEIQVNFDDAARWFVVHRGGLRIGVNLAEAPQPLPGVYGSVLLATGDHGGSEAGLVLGPRSAAVVRVRSA
jgi:maltooligosyltrehalose trehalohydrolase